MNSIKYGAAVFLLFLFFKGCTAVSQNNVEKVFQTTSANSIKNDYIYISKELIFFKDRLDKRNPNAYNRSISNAMYTSINDLTDNVFLKFNSVKLNSYQEYLQMAFSKSNIQNRNDFLILGIYKAMYDAYDVKQGHQLTAITYDKKKIMALYQYLQVIKWKLCNDKNDQDEYLFLTWQNNWQIELSTALKQNKIHTYEDILQLASIKEGKESLFSPSNSSFEVILSNMIARVKASLETLGVKPVEVGIDAMKFMFIFI